MTVPAKNGSIEEEYDFMMKKKRDGSMKYKDFKMCNVWLMIQMFWKGGKLPDIQGSIKVAADEISGEIVGTANWQSCRLSGCM